MTLTTMLYKKNDSEDGCSRELGLRDGKVYFWSESEGEARFSVKDLDWIINSLRMVKYQLELEREEKGEGE